MLLVLIVWLCSLTLSGLVITPLAGLKVAGIVSIGFLLALLVICWGLGVGRLIRDRSQHRSGHHPEA
ncbi:MAG: hypothetical protein M5U01_37555 [Ardenticatenaceae bacterium]|nr:hypothetical protein [Ardenticatenaceae bacterium]